MLYIVLPAYNEAPSLTRLVPDIVSALTGQAYTIIVVDDGSTDNTPELMQSWKNSFPVHHLRLDPNQGYGAAIRAGILKAIEKAAPNDIVLTLDSDRSHLPEFFAPLVAKIQEGYDVVTASYRLPLGKAVGVPLKRRIMSDGVNALLGFRFRLDGVGTYTNGFRAYRVSALRRAAAKTALIQENGFAGGTELFLKVCLAGGRAGEIPFTLRYDHRGNDSKINLRKTTLGYMRLLQRTMHAKP